VIVSPDRRIVISSFGWVEHDALWRFDAASGAVATIRLGSGARWVSVHHSGTPYFSVAHHFDGPRFELTVREFDRPGDVVASARVDEGPAVIEGASDAWQSVPELYTTYLRCEPWNDYVLVRIATEPPALTLHGFPWFDSTFDKGYQGVIEVLKIPGRETAIVSVTRCSDLFLHDLGSGRSDGRIRLAGALGNPHIEFAPRERDLWATDYDTLVVVDGVRWRAIRSARLQAASPGTQLFIGGFSFAPDEDVCFVARPFNRDVAAVDVRTLKPRRSVPVSGQPFDVAALGGGRFVARDWKTGALLFV
jgi:hypothetical protein